MYIIICKTTVAPLWCNLRVAGHEISDHWEIWVCTQIFKVGSICEKYQLRDRLIFVPILVFLTFTSCYGHLLKHGLVWSGLVWSCLVWSGLVSF